MNQITDGRLPLAPPLPPAPGAEHESLRGHALVLGAVLAGVFGSLVLAAHLIAPALRQPSAPLIFPVDSLRSGHPADEQNASYAQTQPLAGTSITPITSVAAGSSGIAFSGDAYEVLCTTTAAASVLYPAVHDGTSWYVYTAFPCTNDGTITKISCIFPAKRGSGNTWNVFKTGAATVNGCTAEQRYTNGSFPVAPAPPLTASGMPTGINAANIADGSISNTEFQYLNNVSSNIQTQLDAKLAKAGGEMSGNITMAGAQTVDGRDVSADGAKLDGLPASMAAPGAIGGGTPGAGTFGTLIAQFTTVNDGLRVYGTSAGATFDAVGYNVADINGAGTAAEVKNFEGGASKTERVNAAGAIKVLYIGETLADDTSIALPVPSAGYVGFIMPLHESGGVEYAPHVLIKSDGSVTLGSGITGNVVNTDTDAKLCIFNDGGIPTIRNRLGASRGITGIYTWR